MLISRESWLSFFGSWGKFSLQLESFSLYAVDFLRNFSLSLLGIFLPLFVFQFPQKPLFLTNEFSNNLFWLTFFYFLINFGSFLANLFLTNLIFLQLGFRKSLALGLFLLLGSFFLFLLPQPSFPILISGGILLALATHFYWIPFHIFFVRKTNTGGNYGEESSWQLFLANLASAVGPILSAVIIVRGSFNLIFAISIAVLAASFIFVFRLQETKHTRHRPLSIFRQIFSERKKQKLGLAFLGRSGEGTIFSIFWPVVMLISFNNILNLGAWVSVSIFVSSLALLFAGRLFEKNNNKNIFKGAVLVNSWLYFLRLLPLSAWGAGLIDFLDRFNGNFYNLGLTSSVYDLAKDWGESDFILFRELVSHLAAALVCVAILIFLITSFNWRLIFVFAGFLSLLTLFVYEKNNQTNSK